MLACKCTVVFATVTKFLPVGFAMATIDVRIKGISPSSSYMSQWLQVGCGKLRVTAKGCGLLRPDTAPQAWLELAKCMTVPTARALPGVFTILASAAAAVATAAVATAGGTTRGLSSLPPQAHVAVSKLLEVVNGSGWRHHVVLEACVVAAHGLGPRPCLSGRAWRTLVTLVQWASQRACIAKAVSKAFSEESHGQVDLAEVVTAVTAAAGAKIAVLELLLAVLWRCPTAVCGAELRRCPAAAAHLWMHRVFAPPAPADVDCDSGSASESLDVCARSGGAASLPVRGFETGLSGAVSLLSAALMARLESGKLLSKAMCCWWLPKPVAARTSVLCLDTECIVCRGTVREDCQGQQDLSAPSSSSKCAWQTLRCGCVMHVNCLDRFASRKPGYWDNPKCLQCQREWLKLCISA
jgi:hypothetical protein